jgi:hypothetical protein
MRLRLANAEVAKEEDNWDYTPFLGGEAFHPEHI